jgi:hypothetical protein
MWMLYTGPVTHKYLHKHLQIENNALVLNVLFRIASQPTNKDSNSVPAGSEERIHACVHDAMVLEFCSPQI